MGRDRVVGRALEHGEVVGLLGDERDRLDRRGSGADHPDAPAGEVDATVRPAPGVVGLACEAVDAGDVGLVHLRQAAHRRDEELRRDRVTVIGVDHPAAGRLVEVRAGDACLELDVGTQVEPVRDVVCVLEDLGLCGVPLRPLPLLLELVREAVGVLHALDVTARTGIAVPVPRAADARAGFVDPSRQTEAAHPMEHVHAREPGADDNGVVDLTVRFGVPRSRCVAHSRGA